eukprot:5073008-Amphidinium_carterae.1
MKSKRRGVRMKMYFCCLFTVPYCPLPCMTSPWPSSLTFLLAVRQVLLAAARCEQGALGIGYGWQRHRCSECATPKVWVTRICEAA